MTSGPPLSDLRRTAADLVTLTTGVLAVDVIDYDPALDRPAVEIVVGPESRTGTYDRVPPRVLRKLAEADLGIVDTDKQGDGTFLVLAA